MKKINLTEMLQGCSKRNGTAVYASNPDGQPTVNRRSRLTSYPGEMNKKEQTSSTCPRFALVLPSFCSRLDSLSLVSRQSDLDQVRAVSAGFSARVWKHVAMIFTVLVMSMANIDMAWGAINNTTVTKAGSSQKYIDVKTTAASNGDEVTVAKQYIAYTINDLLSSGIKSVWYTQSSSGSGSSNTDAVSITGYRTTCNKYIAISSSKTYTHYVTNCVSFSALYDPRGSSRYCTITATNVDDAADVLTITNSGTVSSGTKYNVELTGLAESKYYRVVVKTNNSSESRIYQIRLGAPACDAGDPGNISIDSFDPATSKITLKAAGSAAAGDTWYWQASASGTSTSEAYVSAGKEITAAGTYYLRSYNGECWSDAKSIEVTAADFVVKYAITKGTHVNGDFTISPTLQEAGEEVTLVASPSAGYLLDAWNIIKTADGSATGITVTNNKFTMPAYAVTVNATFVVDPCSAWGYGTANTTAPSSGNSVTVGDLTVANVGCSTSSTTPFSGGTSTGVILGNGTSKYITGTLGGNEIASIRFSIYTTDASKPTYVVAFSSSASYDASTVLKVSGDYTAYFYNDAPETTGTRKDVEVTAPAGAKSFAIGRNLSGVSHGGTEQNSGSRGVYYIAACPADEPSCGSMAQTALALSSNSGTICGTGSTTFTVSGGSGSGALSVSSSDETKATASIDGSTVTVTGVAAGSATITVTKACDATYAEKTATYSATVAAIPTANAGVDKTTEPGNGVALAATAAASGCTGAWTIQSGPNTSTAQLSSTSSATATFTPTVAGTYTLRWTVTNTSSSCSAYDEMTVSAAVCSISECGNATLTYPIYTAGNLTTSNLFSGASSTNATAVSVGSSPAFTGVTVSAATKGSSANAGACYAKSTALTGKMQYSASSKSSSYYIDFPFTVNTGYTFTPCDVQVVIQPVSSNQAFTVEITNGTNVYGTSTATLNAGVMEPIIGLTSPAEMSAGNYAIRLYPHGGSSKEFRMGANVILKGTTASATPSCTAPTSPSISGTTAYTEGQNISLTASATGTDGSTTYTWYKGADWATASATTPVQAASTSGATFTKASCVVGDAGTYWCNISNGTGCEVQTSKTITVATAACDWNINYITNGLKDGNASAVWSENNCFTQVGSTNEWILENFEMPDVAGQFWVGPGSFGGHSVVADLSTIKWVYRSDKSRTSKSAVTNMTGTLNIWSNSGDDNYYTGIYPDYQITYGVDGSSGWTKVDFNHVSGTEYRTAIVTAPSGYKNNDNFKYYVGLRTKDNGNTYWGDHSSTVKMNGMSGMSSTDQAGKKGQWKMYEDSGSDNYYCSWIPVYTLTYNANGGIGAPAAQEVISDVTPCQWTLSTTQPTWADHVFLGWSTNSSASVPDAASEVADLGTPYPATGDVTLYAVWTSCSGPTINSFVPTGVTDGTHPVGTALGNLTVTASAGNGGTLSYLWYQYDGGNIGAAVAAAGTNNAATYNIPNNAACVERHYYCVVSEEGCSTTRTSAASGALTLTAANLTALECNTLYTPADMLPSGKTISSNWQYDAYGLSGNTKFFIVGNGGDQSTAEADAGIVEIKTGSAVTISGTEYSNYCYFKKAPQMSGTTPTSKAIKFILSGSGSLDVYGKGVLALVKEGGSPTTKDCTSTPSKVTWDNLTAGTYYLYATGTSRYMVAMQFNCCTTPAAPTAFSAGSITSTGATFSITDAGDAASYDIYYSTSSTAPTASTAATTTSTSKTKEVTGLTASTTYYAWVRSVCDADHKSAWVALGTTSFTTSAAEPTALVTWQMKVDQAAWALKSGTTEDGTNITSIASTADEPGSTSTGITGTTGKVVMASGESNVDKAASFTFTVNSAKKVVPEKVTCKVLNVSSGNRTYKAQLSDNNGHVYYSTNTVSVTTENVLTDATFNFASSLVLTGNVTLKVYAWKTSGSPTQFRMGEYVKLFGEVDDYSCTALNLTRGGQENGTYTVGNYTGNPLTCTVNAGEPASYQWKQYTLGQGVGEAVNAVGSGSTTTSFTPNPASANTYFYACEVTDICGNTLITPYTGTFVFNTAVTYSVTHSLTNVTATSGATGAGAATEGVAYNAVFAANTGYVLPSTITVTIGGSPATVGTGYTWNATTGAFQVPAAQVTGAIVITIAGETAPATKDIYYGHVKITDGALVREIPSGATQFFTNIGGTVANNTEISLSSTPSTGGIYYNSNNLTDAELSKSSNWGTSSGSNRYIRGLKFANSTTYTLALGTKVASTITFYGWCGSASKTMTVGGEEYVSSATKNTFGTNTFVKSGGFTGNVSITQDGDFYGILVITIQTATPCTTPVIPALSNQTVCEGSDIAAWDATPTNASTITGKGESIAYSWKKKGNDTELATTATFDLGSSAAESQAGTYVVTVTVSKAGYASSSANKEVELTVTEGEEVTSIVADKATVYPGNSVTLTATANTPATWQWYTCTNAEGAGAAIISGATSASYTIASAPAAGTYYYKVEATGDCGTAERVYTLTVSPAAGGDCFHFVSVIPESNINISSGASIVTPTHATTLEGGTMKVGSQQVVITAGYGLKMEGTKTVSITLDAALEAGNVVIVKGTSGTKGYGITINGVNFYDADNKTFDVSYTVVADDGLEGQTALTVSKYSGSSYLQEVKITGCGESCTDPEVTASADNTTVCVGTSVTLTAANAHASATYQWQKLDGTWTNISGATASTYTIASVVAGDAGKYRVIASHDCNRTSNEVTLSVPSAPDFGSTVPASVSIMQTLALSISTVEATDAVKYRWYKSADATWDAGDTEIGTNKELIKAYDSEAIGSPSYYVFCRAQNACGITTSTAIAVNVTAYVEEDCATRGNESDAAFSFENSGCGQGSYQSANCWTMNSNSKILVYYPPTGKYFKTAKVTIASSSESKASYNWSTNGGTSFTAVSLTVNSTLTERTIDLSAHGNVNAFQIGRNFDSKGSSGGTLYVSKICFEYTDACTATTVTPSTESTSYDMGGEWTNPTFTLSVAGTLTYSSSNEDIASVDDDGTVTFNGEAGTVTITASYAGGTISATDYCASSGSYTITVSCPGGAPKVVADGSVDMSGCNSSVTLHAKKQDGTAFADGTYQWFRNGEEIDGATSSSYTATQAGTYTVERTNTSGCTTPSTNSAVVTSETTEPEVERLVPFQYYHVDSIYRETSIMRFRHLFAVKNSGKLDGKSFKMYVSRNGGAATDVTSSNALVVVPNGDGHVDTVMVDLNKLSGKYSENDELVFTCKAIDCSSNISDVYKNTITMNVIGATPTLALICSGSNKAGGTRKTGELTVGGDFLTGYNVADLCQQTGNTSFDANTEWGLYTRLKENYIVTPVNGYAVFNKLNYEPFDILLLTDYPKASKSDAAKDVLDDMADLCDYRPMLSFKAHMVAKTPSKWAAKGFTTSPVVPKNTRTRLNIVCYAHPMFSTLKSTATHIQKDNDDPSQIVYTMLTGAGYEGSKGLQGFELEAAENFVTIGLVHYNATPADGTPSAGLVTWTPGGEDRMLVTAVERQENLEARMIMFAVNCGAQSKFTETGRNVVLRCLEYLLDDDPLHVADCSFTFDNGAGNSMDAAAQKEACESCTGTKGDGKWSTAANWGPDYVVRPGKDTEVKIAAPVTVDPAVGEGAATNFTPKVRSVRILEGGQVTIPAGSYLEVVSTIRRMDDNDIYPTEANDIHIGSASTGNGTLIFNNNDGDTKARVDMYSNAKADVENMSAATSTWQYIGTPHSDVANARYNYYNSWLYQYSGSGWEVIPNGGPLVPFRGYCVTHPDAPVVFSMEGTLAATTTQDIAIPAGYTVIANSWTAPIDINAITDNDMENISDKAIYFFNTGSDVNGTGTINGGDRWAAGTYVSVPIHSAPYTGDDHIPSMQGFYVWSTTAGTLHLDYDRHVRGTSRTNKISGRMHAPKRVQTGDNEPEVLKIIARGNRYDDRLVVLEREDFTRRYESGWDGEAWGGSDLSPMVYITNEAGVDEAVSAIPEFEGTVITFRAGEDSEYRFEFTYSGETDPLYLYDMDNNTYTQIMTGNAYYFTTSDKAPHSRFILTRQAPQVTTGCEYLNGSEGAKAKKLIIEDKMYIMLNGALYDATGKAVK